MLKFISQLFSRKVDDPIAEKQKVKNKAMESILHYVQSRTIVREGDSGYYDSVSDSEKIRSQELLNAPEDILKNVYTFKRTVLHAFLINNEHVFSELSGSNKRVSYDIHSKILVLNTTFRNYALTGARINLAVALYKEVNQLNPSDKDFYPQLRHALLTTKQNNTALDIKHHKVHRSGNRFFGKGTWFQSQLDNTLSSALSYFPKEEKAENIQAILKVNQFKSS